MAAETEAADYETFLRELEEDKEMRDQIDLFKDPDFNPLPQKGDLPMDQDEQMDEDDGDEPAPEVGLDELIDGLDGLGMDGGMFGALGEEQPEIDDSDL